jgi:hypothetical protein
MGKTAEPSWLWTFRFLTSPRFWAGFIAANVLAFMINNDWFQAAFCVPFFMLAAVLGASQDLRKEKSHAAEIEFEKEKSRIEAIDPTARLERPRSLRGRSQR